HPRGAEPGAPPQHLGEERGGRVGRRPGRERRRVVLDGVVEEVPELRALAEERMALEAAETDVRMAEPDEHGRARRRGLVAAEEHLAGLEERERLRGVDAERLEHRGREDLADATLQGEPPVALARPRRLAAALRAEVEEAAVLGVAELRE